MQLLNVGITGAVGAGLSGVLKLNGQPRNLTIQANFIGGTGGTSVDAYVQTSLDGGATWTDIAEFSFTNTPGRKIYNLSALTAKTSEVTPTDGNLSANTSVDGVMGSQFRCKYVTVGTYSGGTALTIDVESDQIQ